ncbi:Putative lumazine-binding protein (plasmid) [Variovorax sp. SRS16]|uniref:nuclear transport factor 2 family protein n=1 Tax=Variovorax sp. SRS16 TaxID=282217 RepID=UPI00131864F9|nr:nuclear transport factor 2 family protein [Variovorax sp. SRS16]VTU45397.1 Putative lumazine-binding protein [Variovorax sp. SRS16]
MDNTELQRQVRRLAAESEIRQTIYRYCRGIDRRDWKLMESAFHPDATDNHGVYSGTATGFIESTKPRHNFITMSMHNITNIMIEFKSDREALAESYCIGVHRYSAEGSAALGAIVGDAPGLQGKGVELTMWVRYLDIMTRRDGAWRIAERQVIWEGMRSAAVDASAPPLDSKWVLACRDSSDPVFARGRELGLPSAAGSSPA